MQKLLSIVLVAQLLLPVSVWAQTASTATGGAAARPASLDLKSTQSSLPAASLLPSGRSVTINVGGTMHRISGASVLTPAEYVAASQVLQTGRQSIQLAAGGNAVRGSFVLNRQFNQPIGLLDLPKGVVGINDFAKSALNLSGDFINAGKFYAISTNPATTTATISAANIINQPGALLTTVLPKTALPGFSNSTLVKSLSLDLNASQNIANSGTISSASNLSLTAGNTITNALPAYTKGAPALMRAAGWMSVEAPTVVNRGLMIAGSGPVTVNTENLINGGMIRSVLSNIDVENFIDPAAGLMVSNNGGVIQAMNDVVRFRVLDESAKNAMTIKGGDVLGRSVLFNDGNGALDVSVRDIGGVINLSAGTASFEVARGTHGLNIQSFNITGDPNLIYTGVGPFTSTGFVSAGGVVKVDTTVDSVNGSINFTGDINTTPASAGSGGLVLLTAGTTISAQNIVTSANTAGNGGDVTLMAVGSIAAGNITASGAGGGTAGNITIAGGRNGTGNVTIGSITAAGSPISGFPRQTSITGPQAITAGQLTYAGNVYANAGTTLQTAGVNSSTSGQGGDVTL